MWQGALALLCLILVTAVAALLHSLPQLSVLPKHMATYILIGIGFVLSLMAIIGCVTIGCILTDKWWTWTKRAIFKRTRNRVWDLEYDVQEAKRLAKVEEYKAIAKLAELKNATWEV